MPSAGCGAPSLSLPPGCLSGAAGNSKRGNHQVGDGPGVLCQRSPLSDRYPDLFPMYVPAGNK